MRRWCSGLLAGAALVLLVAQPGLAGSKGELWRPTFSSPADFHQIQVDHGTPAAEVTAPIYERVHGALPEAADHALHARFAR